MIDLTPQDRGPSVHCGLLHQHAVVRPQAAVQGPERQVHPERGQHPGPHQDLEPRAEVPQRAGPVPDRHRRPQRVHHHPRAPAHLR